VSGSDDERLLRDAIELSRNAVPSQEAFSVGSVIATRDGSVLATGYSRERGGHSHAEQIAIEKAAELKLDLNDATLYTSLEPCSVRKSGLRACVTKIVESGIRRVVFAMREPPVFVEGHGAGVLADAGIEVIELDADAPLVAQINAHLNV
jgi:pyrimidine deaminase RibD-like protein